MTTSTSTDLEFSTFQKRPAYRYIRQADHLPTCDEARASKNPIAFVKLFNPTGRWTFYACGYDADTRIAWGLVKDYEREIGDVYMPEIVAIRGRFGLPIERDLYWHPTVIGEIA